MKHVHADSLKSVFADSSLSTFTEKAKQKGVNYNSIIYIICSEGDSEYGDLFQKDTAWVWELGHIHELGGGGDIESDFEGEVDDSGDTFNTCYWQGE